VMNGVAELFGYNVDFEAMVEEEEAGFKNDDWRK